MSKKLFAILGICSVLTLVLVACGATSTDASSAPNQVHMNATNFVQSSITIKKGERITLIDDALIPHTIANGTWENGTAKLEDEAGARTSRICRSTAWVKALLAPSPPPGHSISTVPFTQV